MSAAHLHLTVVHLPVVGVPIALAMLAVGHLRGHEILLRFAYCLLVVCGVLSIAAFYSGPPTYELLESELQAEKERVEQHAVIGRAAFIAGILVAVIAIQALLQFLQGEPPARWLRLTIFLGALVLSYLLVWSAHLGGGIRHPEVRQPELWLFPEL